ncbi:aminopeptidase [Aerococcus sp.]|uniref:aminopeptidase n=1 Tax=Aerococcus sp. TaxID=1872398 RepID=UPI0025C705AF|nr:aminopeptidase [Aerococcus sp.]MBR2129311.1 aminopeptidase [Aerococcus sp.]
MYMENFDQLLDKYANLLIEKGINVQKGDNVMIYIAIDQAPLAHYLAKHAYENGARRVHFTWKDDYTTRLNYEYQTTEDLAEVADYTVARQEDLILNQKVSRLSIVSGDPDLLNGIDASKIDTVQTNHGQKLKVVRTATMNDQVKWTVAAAADYGWAKHVFPELAEDKQAATDALWDAIFKASRVYEADPVEAWNKHRDLLDEKAQKLNEKQFKKLHYTAPGTDLTLGLPEGHIWVSAQSFNPDGSPFIANMPTEEVFTAPDTNVMDGYVTSTKPLSYAGSTIEGIKVTFADGKIVDVTADKGEQIMKDLVFNNDGAQGLGEVALVPHKSPISQSNLTFYNTLFDENASNHLAIGAAYPTNVKGGTDMSEEELQAAGVNRSHVHVDFMIGSAEMDIDGIDADGNVFPIFRQGEWAF